MDTIKVERRLADEASRVMDVRRLQFIPTERLKGATGGQEEDEAGNDGSVGKAVKV